MCGIHDKCNFCLQELTSDGVKLKTKTNQKKKINEFKMKSKLKNKFCRGGGEGRGGGLHLPKH